MNTNTYYNKTATKNDSSNEIIQWSSSDIQELQLGLLSNALEELRDRRKSKRMKQESWDWLMEERSSINAFSSESCCSNNGMCIDTLRGLLHRLLTTGVICL